MPLLCVGSMFRLALVYSLKTVQYLLLQENTNVQSIYSVKMEFF